jgi:hypothetical protein
VLVNPISITRLVWVGTGNEINVVETGFEPTKKRWLGVRVTISIEPVKAELKPVVHFAEMASSPVTFEGVLDKPVALSSVGLLIIAAGFAASPTASSVIATGFFSGRIDAFGFNAAGDSARILAQYDFACKMSSDEVIDIPDSERHGKLFNAPTRAVKRHD